MHLRHQSSPVYTIQSVVKPVVKPADTRLYRVYKHSTGCQTRLTTGLITGCIHHTAGYQIGCQTGLATGWTNSGCSFNTVVKPGLSTGLITGWMFVYTIQPVVKMVIQPVWQPAVSCKLGIRIAFLCIDCPLTTWSGLCIALFDLWKSIHGIHQDPTSPQITPFK